MFFKKSQWFLALSLCATVASASVADEPVEKPRSKPEAAEKPVEKPRSKPEATEKPAEKPRSKPEATEKPVEKPRSKPEATEKPAEKPRSKPEATEKPVEKPRSKPEATEKPVEKPRSKPEAAQKPAVKPGSKPETAEKPQHEKPGVPPHLKERLTDLLAQARDAEADGNHERLQHIKAQISEIEQLLKRPAAGFAEIPPEFRPQAERLEILSRRIRHVRTASENLKAAEMHDLAHELAQRAEDMERELVNAKQELMLQMQPQKFARPERGDAERELNALREENQALQRKLRELSEQRE